VRPRSDRGRPRSSGSQGRQHSKKRLARGSPAPVGIA
jgi:hypothetical protein